ncbi:alpha-L-fucosidase [Pelagicoccus mobilis]|uniref:alpha-L-fucosidase n=1 Tax=Pelagicoccus mobilis TaxID=415221 RepID=A0A934RV79_9BACT|nr:alpha-L-fucosidase [Pelagicoccus mobilis]MBK1876045.1 alpha-L-fucosidase [Pelagicoccus mobilis]
MTKIIVNRVLATVLTLAASTPMAASYEENWESLAAHNESPEWFRDAKFGIYFHWGPYSVPAFGNEHYPRTMYGTVNGKRPVENKQKRNYNLGVGFQTFREHYFHLEKYGEPKDVEYHDLFPEFRAENFNAEEWADLFYLAGAQFAGPVAEHHDGYSMWDSALTPWDTVDTGPKRDIVGEISKAIRKRGMKLVTTFHHAKMGQAAEGSSVKDQRRWHYYGRQKYFERVAPGHVDDPEVSKLYGTMPWEDFLVMWNGKLEEVIDAYQPDIIWFDSWLDRIPAENRQKFAAYYLNAADDWGKEVVITYKQEDMPQNLGVVDFEKGRMDDLTDYTWLTDDTISAGTWTTTGSWSYTEELIIKSSSELVHTLIDIVSKNGNLLLNISPRADGTIPEAQKESLLGVGKWLRANGEAIYGTRPFKVYGEGPKRMASSGHFVQMTGSYNEENIRFTTKDDAIYAIQMGWAGSKKEVLIKSVIPENLEGRTVANVSVVDSPETISWEQADEGLLVTTPFKASNKIAICFKIETE